MTEPSSTIGVDRRRREWLIARVRRDSGRPTIEQLQRFDHASLTECEHLRTNEPVVLAIPDDQALVKSIHLDGTGDRTRRATFEMAQAILADESEFVFDSYPTALDNLTIGAAIRRSVLTEEVIEPFTRAIDQSSTPAALLRAIALGRGYAAYAVPEGGELTALVDLGADPVSLCFVHNGRPTAIGWLAASRYDLAEEQGRERLAVELKTVINFKLSTLFEDGLTLPLSGLVGGGGRPRWTRGNRAPALLYRPGKPPDAQQRLFRRPGNGRQGRRRFSACARPDGYLTCASLNQLLCYV